MLDKGTAQSGLQYKCRICPMSRRGFCSDLTRESLADFSTRSTRTLYRIGDEITAQGDVSKRIGVLASGLVKIAVVTELGEEHVIQIVRPGQLVGNLETRRHTHGVETATDAAICWMSRDAWNGFLDEASEHAQAYMSATLRQFHEVHHAMLGMRGRNTRQRVAFWLLDQKQTQAETGEATIRIPLTRRDLASYLDMTVETLCRALHQLADLGAIDLPTPDFVRVLDVGLLRHVAKYPNDRPGHAGDLRTVGGGRATLAATGAWTLPGACRARQ